MLVSRVRLTKLQVGIFTAVFVAIGSVLLIRSFAAIGDVVAFEGELGQISGDAEVQDDSTASGGQFAILHATAPPAPSPPPPAPQPTPTPPPPSPNPSPVTYVPISQADYVVSTSGNDSNPGNQSAPFRSIQRAANVAGAGDVVVVRAGTYNELVSVNNSGNQGAPIVFQSETKGAAVIAGDGTGFQPSNWEGDNSGVQDHHTWVTLRGFTIRDTGSSANHKTIRATTGWTIEDCFLNHVSFGVNIRGDNVTVRNTVIDDVNSQDAHALVGAGTASRRVRNIVVRDTEIRNVNRLKMNGNIGNSGNIKFLFTDGMLVDHILSENNNGPGFWFDWDNINFIIRNSTFRNNRGVVENWEGMGIELEGNKDANAKIYNNKFSGNTGGSLIIAESNVMEVYNNDFKDSYGCVELRNLWRDDAARYVRDLNIHDNVCGGSSHGGMYNSIGDWPSGWTFANHNIRFDFNKYNEGGGAPLFEFNAIGVVANDLNTVRSQLGVEQNGSMVPAGYTLDVGY